MAFKTSSIDLNVPAKVLPVTVTNMTMKAYWDYDDGEGDKWWSGGSTPKPYRWELTLSVDPASHGSHKTRTPYVFNGFDVLVGDFIAGATDGKALQIVSITEKTATSVVCVVEDVLRYNTFRNASGIGIFTVPGQAVVFQTNEFGDPMIDPLPTGIVSADFYANVNSRFKYLNPKAHFVLEKENHTFEVGDVIGISDEGEYEVSAASNLDKLIGTVTHKGPGPNQFMIRPINGIIDFVPALPGNAGDFAYASIDGSGDLTTTVTGAPIFLNIKNAVASTSRGSVLNGTTSIGNVIEINDVNVTFTGTSIAQAASDINSVSGHGIVASESTAPVEAVSETAQAVYGLVGGYPPFAATINGVLVNFTTTTAGQAEYSQSVAIAEDLVTDIIAAGIPNLEARASSGKLYLTETTGSSITIVNTSNDTNGNGFAGASSISGLNASYAASTGKNLLLTRADGGEIIIRNITGTPSEDFGLISGHNGSYPIGLDVEQGIRKAGTTVVSSTAARDLLPNVLVGDQAHVLDTGEGEWGLYLWDGSNWVIIATQDSAATDANSLYHTYVMPSSIDGNIEIITMGRISNNSRVVSVLVEVITGFSGHTGSAPALNIGTSTDAAALVHEDLIDLESVGSYNLTPDYHYAGPNEVEIIATLDHNLSQEGEIKITVTYV